MDLQFTEQNNGGDLTINNNDLALVYGYENMPYISMFGGAEFWGNSLLLSDSNRAYNATTETVMNNTALNSSGRVAIEQAINADLSYLLEISPDTTLTVESQIVSDTRLDTLITFNGQSFSMMWNPITQNLQFTT